MLVFGTGSANADVIGFEDFDGGAINLSSTTNVLDYGSGGGSGANVLGRVSPYNGGLETGNFLDKSVAATGNFDTYTSLLFAGQSGSSLDIRISWAGTPSGGEAMGFDNFTINGLTAIPEPGSLGLIALLGLGFIRQKRS